MTSDVIPCGFCHDPFTREEVHMWDNDWQCYLCPDCTKGAQNLFSECKRAGLCHHSDRRDTRNVSKLMRTRFIPGYDNP